MQKEKEFGTDTDNGASLPNKKGSHATVYLGGKSYTITPLTLGKSQAWRQEFNLPISELMAAIQNAPDTELSDFAAIGQLISTVQGTVLGSMDLVFELLCKYSPVIQADKSFILEHATDDEVMLAFVEVLKLAYPFGRLAGLLLTSR